MARIITMLVCMCSLHTYPFFIKKLGRQFSLQIKNKSPVLNSKKLIVNSPAGYNGFYTLGTTSYIKNNYDLSNYLYSGASAGAWNSLFSVYNGNDTEFVDDLLNVVTELNNPSIYEIQKSLKIHIVENYLLSDFDLDRLFIGVTSIRKLQDISCDIYHDFGITPEIFMPWH